MADSSQLRRILRVHPAHRTVGVAGVASSFGPCRRSELPLAAEPAARPLRVLLVSAVNDGRSDAALTALARILLNTPKVRCHRVDLAAAEKSGLADAECAVVFGRWLQIVGHWSAFDANAVAEDRLQIADDGSQDGNPFRPDDCTATRVEVADAARWHPVLEGVGPFVSRNAVPAISHPHTDTTCLLIHRLTDKVVPVAWARYGDNRAVDTLLGHADDFGQPDFVRLLQNALEWVRQ